MLFDRIKAFIIDMFMIMMPISYFITYIIAGSKETFQHSYLKNLPSIIFSIIIIFLIYKFDQTLGMRAYNLKVKFKKKSLFIVVLRYLIFLISAALFLPLFFAFFDKEKRTLWDIATGSKVIRVEAN